MSTQQVVSFSTAEGEFYGIVRGVTSGTQFHETFMQFGFLIRFWILYDYSVARNIAARIGSDQLKHLEDQIWMFDGKKQFLVESIDTFCNMVDSGTILYTGERFRVLLRC